MSSGPRPPAPAWHRFAAEAFVVALGLALAAAVVATDAAWLDRHFLPEFKAQPHRREVAQVLRVLVALLAALLLLRVRPRIGRVMAAGRGWALAGSAFRIAVAIALALGFSEWVLRSQPWRARHAVVVEQEPLRRNDARLGWTWIPGRVGHEAMGGRMVDYAFDAAGVRVREAGQSIDPARPTIVFAGESYMFGYGLTWDESIPAGVGKRTGLQPANLAVNGYSTDQAYLRLVAELPRFGQPVAIVSFFMSSLFVRNFDVDRPHLDARLHWWPAKELWRLESVAQRLVRYHGTAAIDETIAMTRAVFESSAALARGRGAVPLVLVPQYGPETPMERALRQRVLDDAGLDYVLVPLDPAWRVPGDMHPDARAADLMATAVAQRLERHREGGSSIGTRD